MFFTSRDKQVFTKLRQVFIEVSILNYSNPKRYIYFERDVSGYIIGRIFSQLTLDNLDQWHLVVFFSQKIILTKI